jgi:putative ABC transport system permease protein
MTSDTRSHYWSRRLHAQLLVCYPRAFRERFGPEVRETFDRRLKVADGRGRFALALCLLLAFADVVLSGFKERWHARRTRAIDKTHGNRQKAGGHMTWDILRGDLRMGFRLLSRAPGPTLLSILALAMGIGVSSAMFSVIDGVVLRPLPYVDPDRLVRIRGWHSYPDLQDWTKELRQFDGFGGFRAQSFDRQTPDGTERLPGALITGGLFDVLGIRPALGRLISAADDRPGGEHVAVVSHGFWKRALAGRDDVVGTDLQVVDGTYRIIGVLPPDFELWLTPADVIAPIAPETIEVNFRGVHSLAAAGRLSPGVPLEAAQAEIDALAARLEKRYPAQNRGTRFPLQALQASLVAGIQSTLLLLAGAVALVWLIACVNVTNLQLARALGRRDEMATRRAIGASRAQLTRQLVVEQLMLASAAGVAAVAVAHWLIALIRGFSLHYVPRLDAVAIDGRALLFAACASLTTAVLFGVLPALTATSPLVGEAIGHGTRISRARRRMVAALVVAEIAATVVLMIGGGLLLNSYARLIRVNPGFDPDRLLTFNLTLRPLPRTPRPASDVDERRRNVALIEARTSYYEQVIDALRTIPGVTTVAASTDLPIAEGSQYHDVSFEGRQVESGTEPQVYYRGVSPGFFAAFGLRLIRGRELTTADRLTQPHVAIVNETFARQYYPGLDPIGRRVRWTSGDPNDWITIVGVAADAKGLGLDVEEVPAIYGPFMQDGATWRRYMDFAVRASGDPAALGTAVRRAVATVDPSVPVLRLRTMNEVIRASVTDRRLVLLLLSIFAVAALALAGIGLYGTMAYAVRARTAELGLRLALGATPAAAVRLVLRQAWWCLAIGLTLGVAVASTSVSLIRSLLFQIAPTDLLTYVVALSGISAVALGAALVPATRAARIDPLIVLRRGQT